MKYYIALFQKVKDYYKTQSSNADEIALICPSLRVYEESEMQLMLPQMLIKPELKGEALLKKQDLSFQLNSLPPSDKYWNINPSNTLFEVYSKIVKAKQEIDIDDDDPENAEAQKVLKGANGKPTLEKKAYDKYLNLYEQLVVEWQDHVSKYLELQTDDEKAVWLEKLNLILLKKEKIQVDHKLLGYKKIIEEALKKINKTTDFDIFLANLSNTRSIVDASTLTGIQSLEPYLDINFVPYDFMSSNNGWVKLTIQKPELDALYEVAKMQSNDFPEEVLSIDYEEKNITGIELEFSIVSMQRNWFSLSPILSEFFKWNETKPISDGATISNEFLLPAYPKKLVLIKNLKINIDPAIIPEEVSNINQVIHFGPIIMKNQLFVNANTNTRFIKAIKNKDTLSSNNMKYYNDKAKINKPADVQPARDITAPASPDARVFSTLNRPDFSRGRMMMHPIPPSVTPPEREKRVFVNPVLFQAARVIEPTNPLANVVISINDSISKLPVYKSEISVIGTNNTVFKEIESDQDGTTNIQLPTGNYNIEIKKDGYAVFKAPLCIENSNTVSKAYNLEPESVTYNSFFLIGMICERLPKIPK